MPNEWRRNTLIPIYKNKGIFKTIQIICGIKLMSHILTPSNHGIGHRLRHETTVSDNQFGFMLGRKWKLFSYIDI